MRIGIIGSSGGSVARELIRATGKEHSYSIITDRECGLEYLAKENGIKCSRIEESENTTFSEKAKRYFDKQGGVDLILLFFLRLVTIELFGVYPTLNFHPSLLPGYRGFNALERAYEDSVEQFGATLHLVDEKPDHGRILGQVSTRLRQNYGIEQMHRISFAQKTYLAFYLIDRFSSYADGSLLMALHSESPVMNPRIENSSLRDSYREFLAREDLEYIL